METLLGYAIELAVALAAVEFARHRGSTKKKA
jgi:hypothetical protein